MSVLYLHVGMPKTGTTALQRFFEDNRELLLDEGIDFPESTEFLRLPGEGFRRNALWVNRGYGTDEYDGYIDRLREHLENWDRVLMTDEGVYRGSVANIEILRELKKRLDAMGAGLKIIIYLRRQDEYVYSHWCQKVKETRTIRLAEYINDMLLPGECDYLAYLDRVSEIVGKESLIIKVYDRSRFIGGNIYEDFMDIFDVELTDDFQIPDKPVNISLDGAFLEAKRLLNNFEEFRNGPELAEADPKKYRDAVKKKDMLVNMQEELRAKGDYPECDFFPQEDRIAFMKRYDADNEVIAQKYLNGNEGAPLFKGPGDDRECMRHFTGPVSEEDGWYTYTPADDAVYALSRYIMDRSRKLVKAENRLASLKESVRLKKLPGVFYTKISKAMTGAIKRVF